MICASCGNAVADSSSFCPICGAPLSQQQTPPQPTYQNPYQQTPPQPTYQNPYQQTPPQTPYQNPYNPIQTQGMAWYKFLIYFSLFAGAVLNFISGILLLTGAVYETGTISAKDVYEVFDGLQGLDMIVGIGMLALAVLGFYTRFRLSGYHKNGPTMLNAVYIAGAAIELIYIIGVSAITADNPFIQIDFSSYYAGMFVSIAMVAANTTYFNKRKHLFVND